MSKSKNNIAALLLAAVIMITLLAGCGGNDEQVRQGPAEGQSDLEYVRQKGTLVVGITEFAPMDYRDGDNWIGFDADLVTAFAKELGVEVEFTEINWDDKTTLLENGSIDCLWNGMTMTEELQNTISCTDPYLSNGEVAVFRVKDIDRYQTVEDCSHVLFAVEAGSTGETLIKDLRYRYTTYDTQLEALQSVSSKQTDAAVIDLVMANYYTRGSHAFPDLGFSLLLIDEKSCAGFRADSDLTEKANDFLRTAYENGTIETLAEQYGIEDALLK